MDPYIELKGIHKFFPGVYALKNIDISVCPGEVHALIGENGAGKSTLIKIMSGFHVPELGKCIVNGKEVVIANPATAISLGIGVVYQELTVVDSLNVAENVFYGRLPKNKTGIIRWKKAYADTQAILDRLGLDISPRHKVGLLSAAQKQLVEIAHCLSMNPRIVIMDEPTSSLAPAEVGNLIGIIRKMRDQGIGILYISHKLDEVLEVSDRISVLRDGEFVCCLDAKSTDEEELIRCMVGRRLTNMFRHKDAAREEYALEVEHLSTDKVNDVSFQVRKGEIVGFSGLMGAGRTELAKALIGEDRRLNGLIRIYGRELRPDSIPAAVEAGVGYISEDRKNEGIFPNMSVMKNITIASLKKYTARGVLDKQKEREAAEKMRGSLNIRTPTIDQLIVNLSGGNQQKVIVAKWLAKDNVKVLIVDEPTRGIDVGAKSEIYTILDRLAGQGLAVVVMSSEMKEILSVCDRIYVMRGGRITGEYKREEATQEKLLKSAIL